MRIESDGEVGLRVSHMTEQFVCLVGERHGKSFKIYLNAYDLGHLVNHNFYSKALIRVIVKAEDSSVKEPSWKEKTEQRHKQLEERNNIERAAHYEFRSKQLELLETIAKNTTPVKKRAPRKSN